MNKDIEVANRILFAAKNEFADFGYQGARMAKIAEKAGVNKALINYYFSDKNKLYNEVVKIVFGTNTDVSVPIIAGKWDLDIPQKLYAVIYFLFNLFTKASDPVLVKFFFWELVESHNILAKTIPQYIVPKMHLILRILDEGIQTGVFKCSNPQLVVVDLIFFPMLYLARNQVSREIDHEKTMFKDQDDESVFAYIKEKTYKTLAPEGTIPSEPVLPNELIDLLNSVIDFLKDKKEEGATFRVIEQLSKIIY